MPANAHAPLTPFLTHTHTRIPSGSARGQGHGGGAGGDVATRVDALGYAKDEAGTRDRRGEGSKRRRMEESQVCTLKGA